MQVQFYFLHEKKSFCAGEYFSCALCLKFMCTHTRAQLRGNMNQELQDAPDLFNVSAPSYQALSDTRKPAHTRLFRHVCSKERSHEWYQSRLYLRYT